MTHKILYLSMDLNRWNECEISHLPKGSFNGTGSGSVGFMEVFEDVDTLKETYPDAEILKITIMKE